MPERKGGRRPVEIPSPEADELVSSAVEGDAVAFADLFQVTLPTVYRYLYGRCGDPALAEDLAQDVYVRAMRAVQTGFQGRSSEYIAWLIRIARNRFLDHVKSGRVKWEVVVEDLPVTLASGDPEGDAIMTLQGAELQRALRELTDEQQEIIHLRFFHDLPINEVATMTGRTEGAVKALQFRALRALGRVISLEAIVEDGTE